MSEIKTNKLCSNCCYNLNNKCLAHIFFGEEGIHGTDNCPSYISKEDAWKLLTSQFKG